MAKDYYDILGISKTANEQEIKRAYRKLAHEHHPDKAGGDSDKFKEINQAYEVLSDPKKRQQYDQFGTTFEGTPGAGGGFQWSDFAEGARSGQNPFEGFAGAGFEGISDVFEQFFGGGFSGARRAGQQSAQNRGRDLEKEIKLDFREVVFGAEKTLSFDRQSACGHCSGTGADKTSKLIECKTCGGSGEIVTQQRTFLGTFQSVAMCQKCRGKGKIPEKACTACHGKGVEWKRVDLRVTIPAGIDDGGILRLTGEGEAVLGGKQGDLYIRIRVQPDSFFTRKDDNILVTIPISYPLAVLGGTIRVATLWGDVDVKIPPGTQSHHQFVLKTKGVPHIHGSGKGDQIVTIVVRVPTKPGKEEKRLLEELQKIESH